MSVSGQPSDTVTIVDRRGVRPGDPVEYGTEELFDSINNAGGSEECIDHWIETDAKEFLVVGKAGDQIINALLDDSALEPESIVFRSVELKAGTAQVVAGSDNRGLMYALLELSERVDARGLEALTDITDTIETPDNEVRGAARFLMGPDEDDWFFDEEFWHYYFDRLARARFNRFTLITGFDTAYMSPPYPFLVDVPGYSNVQISDQIEHSREELLTLLRRIADLSHEYGLEFVFGTWQQRTRTVNPDMDDKHVDQGFLVENFQFDDNERLTEYCARGLEELLVKAPEIDGVQLRVNFESGVGDRSTAEEFWKRLTAAPAAAAERRGRSLKLDIRAKGCTDSMIQWAQEQGGDLTISTKYWCESLGLPYHNTQMRQAELDNLEDFNKSRRYSYSDLLQKPRYFDVMYRLWTVGSDRIFLWGDPDYARRFSETASFGGSTGFEVLPPLSMKGGHYEIQKSWPLFDDSELRDYEWEDERYWAWYLLFGRLGYSTETDSRVWEREFEARFGEAGDDVLEAYRAASKVLPLITASHLTRHPNNWNWAELDTGGALFDENNYNPRFTDLTYASAEPSDPAMFYQIDDYVADVLEGEHVGKYTPLQVACWYDHLADTVRTASQAVRANGVDLPTELESTLLDVNMLADLAEYHAAKTRAAVALELYQRNNEMADLEDAYAYMESATEAWTSLAERGEETYHNDLLFAMGPSSAHNGNWTERLEEEIEADLDALEARLGEAGAETPDEPTENGRLGELLTGEIASFPTTLTIEVPETHPAGNSLRVTAPSSSLSDLEQVTLHYRHTNQLEGEFKTARMEETSDGYTAKIPGEYLSPEWDLLVYITAIDNSGNGFVVPGLFHPQEPAPYQKIEIE